MNKFIITYVKIKHNDIYTIPRPTIIGTTKTFESGHDLGVDFLKKELEKSGENIKNHLDSLGQLYVEIGDVEHICNVVEL